MFIGDGAKLVRDAFKLAKEKAPAIIFIDELDAIGTKRFDSDKSGDREVQRTMLELLNQLDGFSSDERIKVRRRASPTALYRQSLQVIAATNRIDILDPALLRSGRLDRKIEFPLPGETARARILEIHSRKMSIGPDVNFEEIARSTDEFNGAQLKAVCVEAGMIALREGATKLGHEHFISGIAEGESSEPIYPTGSTDAPSPNQYKARRRMTSCTLLNTPRFSSFPSPPHILYTRKCLRIYFLAGTVGYVSLAVVSRESALICQHENGLTCHGPCRRVMGRVVSRRR
jgi:SpoVK/Ycf46/Vps4 family AAA+-type ATPase